jgi:hypothetical protein
MTSAGARLTEAGTAVRRTVPYINEAPVRLATG